MRIRLFSLATVRPARYRLVSSAARSFGRCFHAVDRRRRFPHASSRPAVSRQSNACASNRARCGAPIHSLTRCTRRCRGLRYPSPVAERQTASRTAQVRQVHVEPPSLFSFGHPAERRRQSVHRLVRPLNPLLGKWNEFLEEPRDIVSIQICCMKTNHTFPHILRS